MNFHVVKRVQRVCYFFQNIFFPRHKSGKFIVSFSSVYASLWEFRSSKHFCVWNVFFSWSKKMSHFSERCPLVRYYPPLKRMTGSKTNTALLRINSVAVSVTTVATKACPDTPADDGLWMLIQSRRWHDHVIMQQFAVLLLLHWTVIAGLWKTEIVVNDARWTNVMMLTLLKLYFMLMLWLGILGKLWTWILGPIYVGGDWTWSQTLLKLKFILSSSGEKI